MDNRPPPHARVVGRGRISAVPIWTLILIVGVSGIAVGGVALKLIIGVPFTLLALGGLGMLWHSRLWIDGPTLYSRTAYRWNPPIRLDQVRAAHLSDFAENRGRTLWLTPSEGPAQRIDATNLRLVRLYGAMAAHVPRQVANERLQRRMDRYG